MSIVSAQFVMDIERQSTGSGIKWAGVSVCALLAALVVFGIMRSRSHGLGLIRLEMKANEKKQSIKMGTYEQNIGLKAKR